MNRIAAIWKALLRAAPLRVWAIILAGPALSWLVLHLAGVIAEPRWRVPEAQIEALKWALILAQATVLVIVCALAAVGVKLTGPGGTGAEIGGEDKSE